MVLLEAAHCARPFRITLKICNILYKCNHIHKLLKTVSAVNTYGLSDVRSETRAKTNIPEVKIYIGEYHYLNRLCGLSTGLEY